MSRMRQSHANRVDDSQDGIVRALRGIGCGVDVIGFPVDILASKDGLWFCMDCKTVRTDHNGKGRPFKRLGKRTKAQDDFAKRHHAPVDFPSSPEEAVRIVLERVRRLHESDRPFGMSGSALFTPQRVPSGSCLHSQQLDAENEP